MAYIGLFTAANLLGISEDTLKAWVERGHVKNYGEHWHFEEREIRHLRDRLACTVSASSAAKRIGVTEQVIYGWVRDGRLRSDSVLPGIRIDSAAVEAFGRRADEERTLLTTAQVSQILKLTYKQVHNLSGRGELPYIVDFKGDRRYMRQRVDELAEKQRRLHGWLTVEQTAIRLRKPLRTVQHWVTTGRLHAETNLHGILVVDPNMMRY
jgi:predicted site-specific integrase-resolvase